MYGRDAWLAGSNAAIGYWPSGERRTYRRDGTAMTRRLAPVLDYGYVTTSGRDELSGLLGEAARRVRPLGITHLALFIAEHDERVAWLAELADGFDTYAVCAPVLDDPPTPAEPVHIDPILF